jgi:hypothetical protein
MKFEKINLNYLIKDRNVLISTFQELESSNIMDGKISYGTIYKKLESKRLFKILHFLLSEHIFRCLLKCYPLLLLFLYLVCILPYRADNHLL